MGLRILVDGYNFIGFSGGLTGDLKGERDRLIGQLAEYQKIRGIPVCVIFDAWKEGLLSQHVEHRNGVEIIFSRLGETADQVIIRLIRKLGEQCVVVSGDREIVQVAARSGSTSVSPREFRLKLDEASRTDLVEEETEEGRLPDGNRKRGNPNRLSKKERMKRSKLKKL